MKSKHLLILSTFCFICFSSLKAQILTKEDSLNAGLDPSYKNVILAGYGEMKVSYNQNFKTAKSNLTRNVLFVGYRFSQRITFFSELEVENASTDNTIGAVSLEQCVIKFDLNPNNYILAGLIIPRIGFLNENHLPITFNGNDRHFVEQLIIPSTWREMGIGYYGSSVALPGLNWSIALVNGLNAQKIGFGKGITDAKFGGQNATSSNIAISGSLLYFGKNIRLQTSAYFGGSAGFNPREADSLRLNSGLFGTPVSLVEANVQYRFNGLVIKTLATYCAIQDAAKLNAAFASNAPKTMYGYYAEIGYNLLQKSKNESKQLIAFTRFETLNMLATIPLNGIENDILNQQYWVSGLSYFPIRNVAIKLDWVHTITGEPNPALIFNPSPNAPAYLPVNNFYQLGIAYSF